VSDKMQDLVWDADVPGGSKKIVLLALADRANDQGETVIAKTEIVRKCSITEATVKRTLRELLADNLLQKEERWEGVPGHSPQLGNRIWLNIPLLRSMRHPKAGKRTGDDRANPFLETAGQTGGHSDPPGGDRSIPPGGYQTDPRGGSDRYPSPGNGLTPPGGIKVTPLSDSDTDSNTNERNDVFPEMEERHLLAAEAVIRADGIDLRKVDAQPRQVTQIRDAIAAQIAQGRAPALLAAYLAFRLRRAEKVTYLLRALTDKRLLADMDNLDVAIAADEVLNPFDPDPCGQCEGRPGEARFTRRVEIDGRSVPCPTPGCGVPRGRSAQPA
jgi:hypothetical protein